MINSFKAAVVMLLVPFWTLGAAEVKETKEGLVDKVDSYLNYVVENWMKENEVAVQTGLRTEIAEKSIQLGASMINDIYGGEHDSSMLNFIGSNNIPYVLMHMKGNPINMQKKTEYKNFEEELKTFFIKKCQKLEKLGHKKLIIDPGFGFGKTIDQNFKMINLIPELKKIHENILVGLSRKSMIYKSLQKSPKKLSQEPS